MDKITALNHLGCMSDDICKLNARAERARTALDACYRHGDSQKRAAMIARCHARYLMACEPLQALYADSVRFSAEHNVVVLPVPSALCQR